jgi:glycosyltransferase involved in cell wall biosynthesis
MLARSTVRQRLSEAVYGNFVQMSDTEEKIPPRSLKILHIGNIANNAYNNAKILIECGHICHVVSYDYFHILSCPEWEDGDVGNAKIDDFYPDWWATPLKSSPRPRWFVQARYMDALLHLQLMNGPSRLKEWFSWSRITYDRYRMMKTKQFSPDSRWRHRHFMKHLMQDKPKLHDLLILFAGNSLTLATTINHKILSNIKQSRPSFLKNKLVGLLNRVENKIGGIDNLKTTGQSIPDISHLIKFKIKYEDALPYSGVLPVWRHIFKNYDIIIGYSTDPAIPMLAGISHYCAYEHGTIRAIPFVDDPIGRLSKSAYQNASIIFITNTDNLEAADRLGLTELQRACLPHAFDEKKLLKYQAAHADIQPPTERVIFIAPARQDWTRNDPNWSKGNDKIFRAAAPLACEGRKFVIRCIAWGVDLQASKEIVAELGLENHVEWLEVMPKSDLWREYLASHAVIDQFVISVISGVTFEALTFGKRVITMDDGKINARFFAEPPPLLPAMTVKDITNRMREVLDDPDDKAGIGQASSNWLKKYHSKQRIAEIQEEAFYRMLMNRTM